jgi:hypothetical protein
MRAHIIESGVIINTIEVENLDFLPNLIDASIGGGIGWGYVDGVLIPPEPTLEPVPTSVSMVQARLQLLALGVYATVCAAISTMSEKAQIEWEFRGTVERGNALVAAMVGLLGWSEADTDNYFIAAGKL